MNYKKVARTEKEFSETGNARGKEFELTPFSIPIPGEELKLDGFTARPKNGYSGYYYPAKHKKVKVVLHFTVGHIQGDMNALTDPNRGHVSTAFVLGRNGNVYQLFSSAAWSYHLGKGAIGGNGAGSKKSIGIEISSYGPLKKVGNNLESIYSRRPGHDVYCSLDDTDQYIKLPKPYRGYQYFAAFTDEQYHSLIVLLRYLTTTYNIPRKFLPENRRYLASEANALFKGINSHVNYRTTKVDIGPAFDWNRVINGVTSETYISNPLEAKVAELEAKVEAAKKALAAAEHELAHALDELDQAALNNSRSVEGEPEEIPYSYDSEEAIEEDYPHLGSRDAEAPTYDPDEGPDFSDMDRGAYNM